VANVRKRSSEIVVIWASLHKKDNHEGGGGHHVETGEDGDEFWWDRNHRCFKRPPDAARSTLYSAPIGIIYNNGEFLSSSKSD
jgi:hypothetical protein